MAVCLLALRWSIVFKTDAEVWVNLQVQCDLYLAEKNRNGLQLKPVKGKQFNGKQFNGCGNLPTTLSLAVFPSVHKQWLVVLQVFLAHLALQAVFFHPRCKNPSRPFFHGV